MDEPNIEDDPFRLSPDRLSGSAGLKQNGFAVGDHSLGGPIHNLGEETIKAFRVKVTPPGEAHSDTGSDGVLVHGPILPHRSRHFEVYVARADQYAQVAWEVQAVYGYTDYDLLKMVHEIRPGTYCGFDFESIERSIRRLESQDRSGRLYRMGVLGLIVLGLLPSAAWLHEKTGFPLFWVLPVLLGVIVAERWKEPDSQEQIAILNALNALPVGPVERKRLNGIVARDYSENKVARRTADILRDLRPRRRREPVDGFSPDNN